MAEIYADLISLNQLQDELSRLRGRRVSTRTIRRWTEQGMPCIRRGQLTMYDIAKVRAWFERGARGGLRPPLRRRRHAP